MSKYVIFTTEYNLGWYFFKHCTHSPKGFRLLNISFSCLLLVSPFNDTTEMSFIPFLCSSCLSALCYFLGIPESSPPLCVLPQLSSLSFYCSNLFFSWRPSFSFSMRTLNLSYFMNILINSIFSSFLSHLFSEYPNTPAFLFTFLNTAYFSSFNCSPHTLCWFSQSCPFIHFSALMTLTLETWISCQGFKCFLRHMHTHTAEAATGYFRSSLGWGRRVKERALNESECDDKTIMEPEGIVKRLKENAKET